MQKNKIILFIVIIFTNLLLHLTIINDFGLSWDFHFQHYGGLYHLGLPVPSVSDPPPVPFSPPDPRLTVADPFGPFSKIPSTLTYLIFYDKLHIMPFDSAYNISVVLFGIAGIGVLFLFIAEAFGNLTGILSALFVSLYPVYFGYLHNDMKDVPSAFAYTLSIYLFWRLIRYGRIKDLLAAAFAFAFAFNTKINAITIPVVCLLYLVYIMLINDKRLYLKKRLNGIAYFLLAPLSAFLLWWPFWKDPLGKLLSLPVYYSHNTLNIPVFYLGRIYLSGVNVPWHYPFVYLAISTPLFILFLFLVGSVVCLSETGKKGNENSALILIWFIIPLLRYFLPSMGVIDGVRHFLEVIFPVSALAAIGGVYLYRKIKKYIKPLSIVYILFGINILILLFNIIHYHPYETSFVNAFAGGLEKSQKNFDVDFWGTPQKEAVNWLNLHVPKDSVVNIVMAQSTASVYLRPDLLTRVNTRPITESNYVVILNRRSFFSPEVSLFLEKFGNTGNVVYMKKIDNVPLVWIIRNF